MGIREAFNDCLVDGDRAPVIPLLVLKLWIPMTDAVN